MFQPRMQKSLASLEMDSGRLKTVNLRDATHAAKPRVHEDCHRGAIRNAHHAIMLPSAGDRNFEAGLFRSLW